MKNYDDPFSVGQIVGMMVVLTYIEQNGGIEIELLEKLNQVCAEKSAGYLERPPEDVFLLINELVKDIEK